MTEDSALKGGAKVCQHQLVNEVLRLLVTEFVINFGRKDATPIQRAFQSGLLSRIQAVKLIRHSTLPDISQPPDSGWSPVQRTRFKRMLANMVPVVGGISFGE